MVGASRGEHGGWDARAPMFGGMGKLGIRSGSRAAESCNRGAATVGAIVRPLPARAHAPARRAEQSARCGRAGRGSHLDSSCCAVSFQGPKYTQLPSSMMATLSHCGRNSTWGWGCRRGAWEGGVIRGDQGG